MSLDLNEATDGQHATYESIVRLVSRTGTVPKHTQVVQPGHYSEQQRSSEVNAVGLFCTP